MSRQKMSKKNRPPEIKLALATVGIFSRIARRQGVTASHVIKVAKGIRPSPHISEAIIREVRKLLSEIAA